MKKLLFTLLILLLPSVASAATIGKVNANNIGLVGYWTFDGADMSPSVMDKSGNGNTGILTNSPSVNGWPTGTTTVVGVMGQALSWTALNLGIVLLTPATLNDIEDQGGGGVTGSVWVKSPAAGSLFEAQVDCQVDNGTGRWRFFISSAGVIDLCKEFATTNLRVQSVSGAVSSTGWNHIVYTWDGSASASHVHFYVNGQEVSSYTLQTDGAGAKESDAANSKYIANGTFTGQDDFVGTLDDARLYKRVLSLAEIKVLYKSGSAKVAQSNFGSTTAPLSSGLVGYWTLDGSKTNWATGKTLDSSGAGNIGQLLSLSTSTTPIYGKIGQAMQFYTGSSPRVSVSSGIIGTSLPNGYAAGAWYKTDVAAGERVFERGGSDSFSIIVQSGFASCFTTANGGSFINHTVSIANATDGNWHHIICNYNAPQNRVELYFDGVMRGSVTAVGLSIVPSAASFTFPARGGLFQGIDDVRVYDRALTTGEVSQLYNQSGGIARSSGVGSTTAPLSNGLVGYWTFDGPDMIPRVMDKSGSGNNGVIQVPAATTTEIGKMGQALQFNGNSQRVDLGNAPSLALEEGMTITGWIKPIQNSIENFTVIFSRTNNNINGYILAFTNNRLTFYNENTGAQTQTTPAPIVFGQWQYVTVVKYPNDTVIFYYNGVQQAGTGSQNIISAATAATNIGATDTGDFGNFPGAIDDLRIYNRALSTQEIQQLYNMAR